MRPASTYRLQIRPAFPLGEAARVVPYLRDLGVSWAYLSPLLRATTGSDHGYDVVDPSQVDPARGGPAGLDAFAAAAHGAGLGVLADIVPNHMGISVPRENPWWWGVLREGRDSPYAPAFDIDWDAGRLTVPVLGAPLEEVAGDITIDASPALDAPDGLLRYFEHVFPLAPGSLEGIDPDAPDAVGAVLERQHYRLMYWRDEASELNYRRFFAVTTLAGVRVEDPLVFDAAHAEILRWVREGLVDGLRIDHPDGLRDPGRYLERLATTSGGAYVLVEKILEHGEALPGWWRTEGTTGYDALGVVDRVLIDPEGAVALDAMDAALRADSGLVPSPGWTEIIHDTKRMIADTIQVAEIRRLVRCLPHPVARAEDALAEILACFPVYRSYLPAGREHLDAAVADARTRRPDLSSTIAELAPLLADARSELAQRFQQTTGPVMAKGVEDTAFYRYTRLGSLTEVGGDPAEFAVSPAGFHAAQITRQASWPASMTALTTHDTKRGEDVRARLDVLSEIPERWDEVLGALRGIASTGHGPFDSLLWQAIVGAWPAASERLHAYAEKAAREAAEATGWWAPVAEFEARMHAVVDAAHGPAAPVLDAFVAEIVRAGWSNGLSAKLLQLAGPGVPDVYQGSELWEQSLVDPDNRRPVDFGLRARMLAEIDDALAQGRTPQVDESGAAKLLLTSRVLRLRRDRPELFTRYTPMTVTGTAAEHAVAFDRGGALAVATRLPVRLAARGGWDDTTLLRPAGAAFDALTGRLFEESEVPLATLLEVYPVALLVPVGSDEGTAGRSA
ncbi:malto-oligosyltrehalose synthase [Microbacterium caowuchunii]|uniref:malto-oligosyltrehalose synthase n=1 Tax=Microbacterium caowuchunii TaxID=2614638 RepID=UPI001248A415|nr:malto-oligosyltrehalose synthase [Microbacterium caowuchunii]QEV98979.1 malto-oligosyltrehalose synthase [Microbacterium caowuchunii]